MVMHTIWACRRSMHHIAAGRPRSSKVAFVCLCSSCDLLSCIIIMLMLLKVKKVKVKVKEVVTHKELSNTVGQHYQQQRTY